MTFALLLILSICFGVPCLTKLLVNPRRKEARHAGSVCLLAGMRLFDHLSVFKSRGKVIVAHCKEVLRDHIYIYIYFSLISLFPFSSRESSHPFVLVSSAVARHIVNMAGAFLLMRVVLKPCGSPFPMPVLGIFSAFVIFPVYFCILLDPHMGEQKWSSVRCSGGHGREGTFLLIPCLLGSCVQHDSYLA